MFYKKRLIVLIILLITMCVIFPGKAKGDQVQQVVVVAEPVEYIQIPSYVKPEYDENFLLVYEAFKDNPKIFKVINCESGYAQFRKDGTPLVSPTSDVGIMQINQVNWPQAKRLGLDIFNSAEDNVAMGKVIADQQGLQAWVCSGLVE